MPAATDQTKDVLTEVLSARVAPGFRDQIRAAARAEGVRPGALIRTAIIERIERATRPNDAAVSQRGQC